MVLIPKKNKIEVYSYLFKEGVLVCHQDKGLPKHPQIPHPVPNLHVIKLMQGFETKGYVKRQYAWQHHYFFLTNEGIEYLRDYLQLPSTIVPETVKRQSSSKQMPQEREENRERTGGFRGGRGRGRGRGRGNGFGGRSDRTEEKSESTENTERKPTSSRGRGFTKDKLTK